MIFMTDASATRKTTSVGWPGERRSNDPALAFSAAPGRSLHGRRASAAGRNQPKLVGGQFAVHIPIKLREQRARRRCEFVEIDFTILVPVDQRRGSGPVYPEAAVIFGLHLPKIDVPIMIRVASRELAPQRGLYLVARDRAIAVPVEGQHQPDILFLLA